MWIWFVLAIGIFNVVMAFVMKTDDFLSSMFFKVTPFFLGVGSLIYFLLTMGLIQ